jgi:hypothetical protein
MTGGRVKEAFKHIKDKMFLLTYGDGLANVNILKLIQFHLKEKKLGKKLKTVMKEEHKIENEIKSIANVKSVTNELIIGPISSASRRAEDTLITSNVIARFFKENKFSPFNIKVVTEDKVVYLMGIVSEKEAKEAEDITKNTSKVTKVVKLFEYLKN